MELLLGLFLVAAGLFGVAGGIFDWDWFMNSYRARFMVEMLGRTGARAFYIGIGSAVAVAGIVAMLGMMPME